MTNEELVQTYQAGNIKALNELLEQNKGIIKKIINRFYIKSNSIDEDDLFQEGSMGLIIAANKYDIDNPYKAKFMSYAVHWINQKISRFINQKNTNEETSLDKPIDGNEGGDTCLCDVMQSNDDMETNIIEKIYISELRKNLYDSMDKINTLTEREVLEFYYGLCCTVPLDITQIGEILDVDAHIITLTRKRAIHKLHANFYKLPIKPYGDEWAEKIKSKRYENTDDLLFSMKFF